MTKSLWSDAWLAVGFAKLTTQKLSILEEAARAGARVVAAWDDGQYEHRTTSVRWQALTRGGLTVTSRQVYVLETAGVRHLYVQPFAGSARLPGVHHVWLPGATRWPVLYDHARGAFFAGQDQGLAAWLQGQPIAQVMRAIDWDWRIAGSTRAVDPVALQLRATRGVGHLAVRAFGPLGAFGSSGLDHHLVGFSGLPRIVQALRASTAAPPEGDQPFHAHADGTEVYEALLDGSLQLPPTPAEQPADVGRELQAVLAANPGTLVLAPVSAKRDAGARREILPAWLADRPILAMHDRTLFGGGTRGVVFTPTHVAVRTDEGRAAIAYSDVTGAGMAGTSLVVRARTYGDFALSVSGADRLAAFLNDLAARPSALL